MTQKAQINPRLSPRLDEKRGSRHKDYGGWVAEFYKSVASTGQPRYDRVTAAIQTTPGERRLFMTRYERLLLPWKTPDEVLVTMLSKRRGDEDAADLDVSEAKSPLYRISAKSS